MHNGDAQSGDGIGSDIIYFANLTAGNTYFLFVHLSTVLETPQGLIADYNTLFNMTFTVNYIPTDAQLSRLNGIVISFPPS